MTNTKEVYLTSEGLQDLKQELEDLKLVKRPEVIQALKEARALGDLSENAEYDAARHEQAVVESRIVELEQMIENAVVIDVGINVDENGNLCGDVDFQDIEGRAAIATPVPGGVGSVTTSVLAKHLLKAAKAR